MLMSWKNIALQNVVTSISKLSPLINLDLNFGEIIEVLSNNFVKPPVHDSIHSVEKYYKMRSRSKIFREINFFSKNVDLTKKMLNFPYKLSSRFTVLFQSEKYLFLW